MARIPVPRSRIRHCLSTSGPSTASSRLRPCASSSTHRVGAVTPAMRTSQGRARCHALSGSREWSRSPACNPRFPIAPGSRAYPNSDSRGPCGSPGPPVLRACVVDGRMDHRPARRAAQGGHRGRFVRAYGVALGEIGSELRLRLSAPGNQAARWSETMTPDRDASRTAAPRDGLQPPPRTACRRRAPQRPGIMGDVPLRRKSSARTRDARSRVRARRERRGSSAAASVADQRAPREAHVRATYCCEICATFSVPACFIELGLHDLG